MTLVCTALSPGVTGKYAYARRVRRSSDAQLMMVFEILFIEALHPPAPPGDRNREEMAVNNLKWVQGAKAKADREE